MKKTLLVTALFCSLLAAGGSALFFIYFPTPVPTSACRPNLSRSALVRVKDDYLKGRFPHWYREKRTLGTMTPTMVFGKITIEEEEYRVPFVAQGPLATLSRIGFVDCGSMEVEYVAEK